MSLAPTYGHVDIRHLSDSNDHGSGLVIDLEIYIDRKSCVSLKMCV